MLNKVLMDKSINEWMEVWVSSAVAGTKFLNTIMRNLPPWILSSVWLQAGSLLMRPLPPPGSQPHNAKCGKGSIFFTIVAENIPGLVPMGSHEVLGHSCTNACDWGDWGCNWPGCISCPPLDSGGGVGSPWGIGTKKICEEYSQGILQYQQKKRSGPWVRQVNTNRSSYSSDDYFCVPWNMEHSWFILLHIHLCTRLWLLNSSNSFLFTLVSARPRMGPVKAYDSALLNERWK